MKRKNKGMMRKHTLDAIEREHDRRVARAVEHHHAKVATALDQMVAKLTRKGYTVTPFRPTTNVVGYHMRWAMITPSGKYILLSDRALLNYIAMKE